MVGGRIVSYPDSVSHTEQESSYSILATIKTSVMCCSAHIIALFVFLL